MYGPSKFLAIAGTLFISLGYPAKMLGVDFASPVSYPVGTGPASVVVADFNGDGKPDIAVANSGSGNVSILLGNGDGTFQAAVNFDAGMAYPYSVAAGDFNGDGKLDLAVSQPGSAEPPTPSALSILLGNGEGTFQTPKMQGLNSSALALAVADFNLDSKADIAVRTPDLLNGTVSIFLGNGDSTFQPASNISVGFGPVSSVVVTDLNGDEKPDVAVPVAANITIFVGKGDGTFQAGLAVTVTNGFVLRGVQAGDINADGKVDLVVESSNGTRCFFESSCAFHISLFLGNGDGSFQGEQIMASAQESISHFTGSGISRQTVGDFNGDGKLDLGYLRAMFPSTSTSFEVRLGRGQGSFSPAIRLPDPGRILAVADLNSDKLSDLVVTGSGSDIGVVLNASPTSGADLGIIAARASAEPAGIGINLTYTADILNEGPKGATGVTFTDTLPNGVSFVSATASQGSCIQSNGIVSCNVGALASAFDASVTIIVTPTTAGAITNTMNVSATEADLASANNSATQNTTIFHRTFH